MAALLIAAQEVQFGREVGDGRATGGCLHAQSDACIGECLHAHGGGVLLASAMLKQELDGGGEANAAMGLGPQNGGVGAHGEGLLVGVFVEDVALPVEPGVQMDVAAVEQELESHLGVGGEGLLGVEHGAQELMFVGSVDVAQHDGEVTETGLGAEEG